MKSILVGNGINIEFGGTEYTNSAIINRLISNLKTKDYSHVFAKTITNSELLDLIYGLHGELKKILKGKYDSYCKTPEEKYTLQRIKNHYTVSTSISGIGMEDYFFILRVFHNRYDDPVDLMRSTFHGMCWLLLDAIYNEGKIQNIYKTIEESRIDGLRRLFKEFDNIFTVNYDCNVEMILGRTVHYLHGDFNTLSDQYNEDTYMGRLMKERGVNNPVTEKERHIYCNGIMGFTGALKEEIINIFQNSQYGIEQMKQRITNGLSKEDEEFIDKMGTSKDEKMEYGHDMLKIIKKHPYLNHHIYPSRKFKDLSGDLAIIGMSPNNDEHIWKDIIANDNINTITYYYKSNTDIKWVKKLSATRKVDVVPVDQFWEQINERIDNL